MEEIAHAVKRPGINTTLLLGTGFSPLTQNNQKTPAIVDRGQSQGHAGALTACFQESSTPPFFFGGGGGSLPPFLLILGLLHRWRFVGLPPSAPPPPPPNTHTHIRSAFSSTIPALQWLGCERFCLKWWRWSGSSVAMLGSFVSGLSGRQWCFTALWVRICTLPWAFVQTRRFPSTVSLSQPNPRSRSVELDIRWN